MQIVNIMTHTNLYLRLNLDQCMAGKPESEQEFKLTYQASLRVFELEFLNKHGKQFASKIQVVARHFADILIRAGKPMHGIIPMKRAINILQSAKE